MEHQSNTTTEDAQRAMRDAHATEFDAWYAARGWWAHVEMRELLFRLDLQSTDVIADIGCGTGRLVTRIAPQVQHVFAGDYSPSSVDVLTSKLGKLGLADKVTPLVADMSKPIDLENASVDKVVSLQAIQHVRPDGRKVALQEFHRILKPGGKVFLEVYSFPSWVFDSAVPMEGLIEDAIYFRRWTRADLAQDLTAAGFRIDGIHPILCWPQLRHLGRLGEALEMAAHCGRLPHRYPSYWLAEATAVSQRE